MGYKNEAGELELLKDSLFLEQMNSFIVEYNFKTKKCYVDPLQKKYTQGDWAKDAELSDYDWRKIVIRQDEDLLAQFFDFSDFYEGTKPRYRSTRIRLLVGPHRYEFFRLSLICYGDADGSPERVLITFTNMQKEMETMDKIEFLMAKDSLTHLPNQEMFMKLTRQMIEKNPSQKYAVIRMDVDRFHVINQLYGMTEGDNVLRLIGVRIQECMESAGQGTYCRIASDMFCICLPDDWEYIEEVIQYIRSSLKDYPINFDMEMSFGIYVTTEEDIEQKVPVQNLMDRALLAQRTVKNRWKHHVAFYNDQLRNQEIMERFIVSEMKDALQKRQFQVYLQPKCEMQTGKIVGSEALVRWQHPEHGFISPGAFIPIFERNGFISEVDYYVWDSTCETIRRWLDEGFPVSPVSVNVSRVNLYDQKLMDNIKGCVDKYRVPHDLIEFEMTESAFVSDNQKIYDLAKALQENNFKVLMDDFGSGYSSLNSLREIPVDVLKIDIKFLPPTQGDERAEVILCSIVDMAQKLGLEVITEGVERIEQAEFLTEIGCRMAQGYYFYRPMTISDFEEVMLAEPVPLSARIAEARAQ